MVTVLEKEPRLGGKVATEMIAGMPVDTGPDGILVRAAPAARMLAQLGLDPLQRSPAATGAFIWVRGRLRRLPAGTLFGVPDRLLPLLRSGLVTPVGFVRAGADLVLPRRDPGESADPTLEQLLLPRFGRQVFDNLIEPMLGGVHAGRASRLSARSAAPEVMAMISGRRSLYRALHSRPARPSGPALVGLDGGLQQLIDGLRDAILRSPQARIVTGATVSAVRRTDHGYTVLTDRGDPLTVDDVVIAAPAWEAARVLGPLAPAAAAAAAGIPYAGVATVTLGYAPDSFEAPLRGTGFLVPPAERRLLVGCSWLTAKWPQLRSSDLALLRCMVGRDGDQAWADLDDAALTAAVRADLAASMGIRANPIAVHIRRLPQAMPQYTVGHAQRLAALDAALVSLPGVHVTGAGYRGVGIASCLAQAEAAAAAVRGRPVDGPPIPLSPAGTAQR